MNSKIRKILFSFIERNLALFMCDNTIKYKVYVEECVRIFNNGIFLTTLVIMLLLLFVTICIIINAKDQYKSARNLFLKFHNFCQCIYL